MKIAILIQKWEKKSHSFHWEPSWGPISAPENTKKVPAFLDLLKAEHECANEY